MKDSKKLTKKKKKIMKELNTINYNPKKNFLEMFDEQVLKNSEINAVVTEKDTISYKDLDLQSDKVANDLIKSGIERGDLIGLSTETNILFIVGILGILKAGGVYLPLDPEYPVDRLNYILKDANPKMILVEEKFADCYLDYRVATLKVEGDLSNPPTKSFPSISLDDPAYVVYTSGSTNLPKGIAVSHRSLPNIGIAHREIYPPKTKALICGGICFDASILAIFHTLLNGGCLYLSNFASDQDLTKLCKFIESYKVNFIISVPSLYEKILTNSSKLNNLLCVSLTGEVLPASLCQKHIDRAQNASLYNEYGPTECAIGTTVKRIYDPIKRQVYRISAGHPLINTRVYVLDENLQPCPIGTKGEIYIEGVGLALGYLNKDELTKEHFKEISLENRKVHVYKTGDLGRYMTNGEVEFLGRIDHQVTLDGRKIYFGEIEGAIYLHPKVKGVVVYVSEKKLAACVTSISGCHIEKELKDFLADLLPGHMIPEEIICLERFPMSPNGKIDRQVLQEQLFSTAGSNE